MAASLKVERGGPGGKQGSGGGCSVGPDPRGRREHVVRQLDRVKNEEPYSDLYSRVCEGLSDSSKVIAFGFEGVSPLSLPHFPPRGDCLLYTSHSLGACGIAVHVTG
ncbi:DDB1- and CUL4-associated factor 15-like isoform 2-T2 [Alca torda]